ncbi:hypothetical protein [Nocardia asiatica]|uniref:hypothetical protein n=1 Tax=Nocardia asiatica TaxID=209252 RepID=UPI003EE1612D
MSGSEHLVPAAVFHLSDREIARAANQLSATIRRRCDELAAELLNEAAERQGFPPVIGAAPVAGLLLVALELAKLRIRCEARVDHEGVVVSARAAGATWEQIGTACGITRQAAYDRWGKMVQQLTVESEPAQDPLEQYDPGGQREAGTPRRRRYVRKAKKLERPKTPEAMRWIK